MNMRENWKANCPNCVASKFTCDEHYAAALCPASPDVECTACNGQGEVCGVNPNRRSRFVGMDDLSPDDFTVECQACNGHGWRPMTDDEMADAAEAQHEAMCDGEPPVSMAEQYQRAADEKRALRS